MGIKFQQSGYTLYKLPKRMSHPPPKVNAMQHNTQTPSETPQQICGRAKSAVVAAVADLRGQLGSGLSQSEQGEVAETVQRMEAQASPLKCDLAVRLGRVDGGDGTGDKPKKECHTLFLR